MQTNTRPWKTRRARSTAGRSPAPLATTAHRPFPGPHPPRCLLWVLLVMCVLRALPIHAQVAPLRQPTAGSPAQADGSGAPAPAPSSPPDHWVPGPDDLESLSRVRRQPARHGFLVPPSRQAPDYGTALRDSLNSLNLAQAFRRDRASAYAVSRYRATVPSGKMVTLHLYAQGHRFAGVVLASEPAILPAAWRHYGSVTVAGTNVDLAREAGYHCTDTGTVLGTLCSPPERDGNRSNVFGCSVAGPSRNPGSTAGSSDAVTERRMEPAGDYCSPLRRPAQVGTVGAWERSARRLRDDIGEKIDGLIESKTEPEFDRAVFEANMHGYRQAVYLAKTIIGSQDPVLGAQIGTAGTVTLDVYDALTTFRTRPPGASQHLAAIGLTGSLVGAGITLAGALRDAPSEAELLFGELRRLSEYVAAIRAEIHELFDGVHEHLHAVYAAISRQLAVATSRNALLLDSVIAALARSHARLSDIGKVQLDTQAILVHEFEWISEELRRLDLALAGCLRPRSTGGNVDTTEFRRCRDAFAGLHRGLPSRQLPAPRSAMTAEQWLTARPDRTLSWDIATFKRLLRTTGPAGVDRAAGLPDSLVGPEAWLSVMESHDGFIIQYPEFASQDPLIGERNEFSTAMAVWRSDLIRFAEEIRTELRVYRDGTRPTVFSELFEEVWSRGRLASILLRAVGSPADMLWNCLAPAGEAHCERLESLASSDYVRDVLVDTPEFTQLARDLAIRGAHLRHWIALAFRDAIGRSEAATALAAGWVAVPDLLQVVQTRDLRVASWPDFVDQVDSAIDQLKDVLQSEELSAEASAEFRHPVLTVRRFPGLGDVPLAEAAAP